MIPPEPIPMIAWTFWKPAPCASFHGSRKLKSRSRRYGSIQIASRPAPRASVVASANSRTGTPETRRIPAIITKSAIVVPRSGSITIRPPKRATTIPTGLRSSPSVLGVGRRERTAQAQTSTASFAISAGWMLIGPTRNQRCAPLIDGATASTATQPTNATARSSGASGRSAW